MMRVREFQKKIKGYYRLHSRDLPWRHTHDPYRILVSEIMLQQTQVSRVQTFYEKFIERFPDFAALAGAKQRDVLRAWQGLGYNRRALAIHGIAKIIVKGYAGSLPRDRATLETLPGIGPYTAGAIRTFTWNEPEIFIETNIRRVFIHFFFAGKKNVHDREILLLIQKTLDPEDPRAWYFALMDYGAMLGAGERENVNRRSAHYARQAAFSGSDREIRGKVLRFLLARKTARLRDIYDAVPQPRKRITAILDALQREGFLKRKNSTVSL